MTTKIRKIQIAATIATIVKGFIALIMICPFCESRWESPDGANEEQYVICSKCVKQSKALIKEQMDGNGLQDRRLFFHS